MLPACPECPRLTWFWMRSLTRSMGAAAVFETAAETPPTAVIVSYYVLGRRVERNARDCLGSEVIDGTALECVGITYSGSPP